MAIEGGGSAVSGATSPSVEKTSTPKFVAWIVGLLGAITLLAGSFKTAVEALDEAKAATDKALHADNTANVVTQESYDQLAKTVNDLTEQLKSTQTEVRILAEYVQTRSSAPGGNAPHAPASAAQPLPATVVNNLKSVEARPVVKLPSFDAIKAKSDAPRVLPAHN